MVDGEGTEVKRGRFPTTCEGLASLRASCLKAQKWRSRHRLLVFLRMSAWMKGDRGASGTPGLCQAIYEEACEDRQGGCQGVSAIVEDGLAGGELCSG